MIEVENLTKRYGDFTAVKGVTFSVAEGEVVGFLGPNAAGKTTTMRILTCFMPATDGTARVAGYDVFDNSMEVRKRIGYMPENVPLYTEMTVRSYLSFMAKIKGVSRKERRERVDLVIKATGLENFRNKVIGKLSKGYRQRVGLAQAMIHNPQVLILDEPTIGLDPRQIIEIRNLIKGLGGEHTVVLSTHILPEASMICNRIIVINEGRIAGEISLKDGRVAVIESRTAGTMDLEGAGNVHIKVRGPSYEVLDRLQSATGVINAQLEYEDDSAGTFIVTYQAGMDIRPELASMIVSSGWELLELRTTEMTLEEAFLELTREEVVSE
ncbi:ABC transporter ATP-binding protein [Candidatus Poribacteria bacterium]